MPNPGTTPVYAMVLVIANLIVLDVLLTAELIGYAPLTGLTVPLDIAALTLAVVATIAAVLYLANLISQRNITQSGQDEK